METMTLSAGKLYDAMLQACIVAIQSRMLAPSEASPEEQLEVVIYAECATRCAWQNQFGIEPPFPPKY